MRIVFGAGYTGSRVAAFAAGSGEDVVATVRSHERSCALQPMAAALGFQVTTESVLSVASRLVSEDSHVIVCFPPDGETDARLSPLLRRARAVSYVSTTGVYGDVTGLVNDHTPLPREHSPSHERVIHAEECYRAVGGTVLRSPGIYGPDRGLHRRILSGVHRIPGDGSGFGSRIHVDDLAHLLLASDRVHGETFVVGDLRPAPHREVVDFVCREYGVALPPSVPLMSAPESLRRDRQVDPSRALRVLGVTLRYPTYREGMARPT